MDELNIVNDRYLNIVKIHNYMYKHLNLTPNVFDNYNIKDIRKIVKNIEIKFITTNNISNNDILIHNNGVKNIKIIQEKTNTKWKYLILNLITKI
tara:strand:- start:2306 stop:2590 length:285 start_codon:yes stop_codon:yes gene_type:complete